MVMLTEVLGFSVTDGSGIRHRVGDLAIALLQDDHPPVTSVFIVDNGEHKELAWDNVEHFDPDSKTIRIRDLNSAKGAMDSSEILLRRDIMDSLILDLRGRRTTRVSDLLLELEDGKLRLKRAEVGMAAMLRRVFRGHWFKADPEEMFDWKYVEFLRGDPSAVDNGAGYHQRINRLPAGEIARLADYLPYIHAAELLKLLPDEKAAEVLEATAVERQLQIIEELDEQEALDIMCLMSPELAADIVGRLEIDAMRRSLQKMSKKCSQRIVELLRYPEDSVGGAMTNDILMIPAETSCIDARKHVENCLEQIRFTAVVFIVDDLHKRRLRGVINLKDMLATEERETLENIMDPYLQTLDPFADAREASYRIVSSQLPAMPVTDGKGKLLGAMTVEAAIALLLPATSGLHRLRVYS
jgi:magnesium transporter